MKKMLALFCFFLLFIDAKSKVTKPGKGDEESHGQLGGEWREAEMIRKSTDSQNEDPSFGKGRSGSAVSIPISGVNGGGGSGGGDGDGSGGSGGSGDVGGEKDEDEKRRGNDEDLFGDGMMGHFDDDGQKLMQFEKEELESDDDDDDDDNNNNNNNSTSTNTTATTTTATTSNSSVTTRNTTGSPATTTTTLYIGKFGSDIVKTLKNLTEEDKSEIAGTVNKSKAGGQENITKTKFLAKNGYVVLGANGDETQEKRKNITGKKVKETKKKKIKWAILGTADKEAMAAIEDEDGEATTKPQATN